MRQFFKFFSGTRDRRPAVDLAVADWKRHAAPAGPLSPAARARLLEAVERDTAPATRGEWRPPLFVPLRTLAWGGLLPALVLAVGLGSVTTRQPAQAPTATTIQVTKQGDTVVFRISNGGRPHTISRSQDPAGSWETLGTVRGEFRDRVADDSGLVFYRID